MCSGPRIGAYLHRPGSPGLGLTTIAICTAQIFLWKCAHMEPNDIQTVMLSDLLPNKLTGLLRVI